MNWILILICLMFAAMLAGPASADTVTALVQPSLLSNPTYAITVCCLVAVVLLFFWLLWWAAGSDRPKVKAELLHLSGKPVVPPSVCQQLLDAAEEPRKLGANEYRTHEDANTARLAKEPTWEIREMYTQGMVRWMIFFFDYHVKHSYSSGNWQVRQDRLTWGEPEGYESKAVAEKVLAELVNRQKEAAKPRYVQQYDRKGNPVGEPLKV